MFLKEKKRGEMVEVLALRDLFDPFSKNLVGRFQHGEEVQDAEKFEKQDLQFLSGEDLPRCWVDPHYRDDELVR